MIKKEKFSIPFFVTISILVLVILSGFYYFGVLSLNQLIFADSQDNKQVDKAYADEMRQVGDDPYLTRRIGLKDQLNGPIISSNDPMLGNKQAPATLVVFSDFQCGVCHKQEAVFKEIIERYKDKVKMIWKDYPDKNNSSISFQASLAGRCANEQNKFWEYHNLLFENNDKLNKDKFVELADKLSLDKIKFKNCLDSGKYKKQVNDNILEANALDINGVPFIYVNSQEVMGEIDVENLGKLINKELSF